MKLARAVRLLAGMVVTALLAACSAAPVLPPDQSEREQKYRLRAERLSAIDAWSIEGRLAVNDGEDGGSGSFNWVQSEGGDRMDFYGALGRGAWRLESDDRQAVLTMADGREYRAADIGSLVREQLGWSVPVEALEWWVRGLKAPGKANRLDLDEQGLPLRLQQQGWNIEFDRYNHGDDPAMPFKLDARRGPHTVKLAIKRWSFDRNGENG